MILKTGRKCKWDEIKVGEVFAHKGCWQIHYKESEYKSITLALDFEGFSEVGQCTFIIGYPSYNLYKLPLSVQRLWKNE